MYVRVGGITDDGGGGGGGVNSVWQSEASQRQLPSSANLRAQARAAGKSEGASQG
jgi:hypothetical protein